MRRTTLICAPSRTLTTQAACRAESAPRVPGPESNHSLLLALVSGNAQVSACTCVGLALVKTLAARIWVFGEGWLCGDPPHVLALSAGDAWGLSAVAGGPPSLRGGCGPVWSCPG